MSGRVSVSALRARLELLATVLADKGWDGDAADVLDSLALVEAVEAAHALYEFEPLLDSESSMKLHAMEARLEQALSRFDFGGET